MSASYSKRLFLEVERPDFPFQLAHTDSFVSLGSCFSVHIGEKLQNLRFEGSINPFGISYNPIMIARQLQELCAEKVYTAADLDFYNQKHFSFAHHGAFSHENQEICLQNINSRMQQASTLLKKAKLLLISPGTAWMWTHLERNQPVNNCHKIPASNFDLSLCTPTEIFTEMQAAIRAVQQINPTIHILFTVSPVRHKTGGMQGNTHSKAALHLAIRELIQAEKGLFYFPAYEILLDELRDYRFFADDLMHPSQQAIDLISEAFFSSIFSDETQKLNEKIEHFNRALAHRPLHETPAEKEKFMRYKEKLQRELEEKQKGLIKK